MAVGEQKQLERWAISDTAVRELLMSKCLQEAGVCGKFVAYRVAASLPRHGDGIDYALPFM